MERIAGYVLWFAAFLHAILIAGCYSPYHADRGALIGGLGGAGVGALAGHALGNTAAGAAVGGATGLVSGALIGGALDESEARNRAMIEERLQRPLGANPVSIDDVVAMSRAGVADELIVNHVRIHGVARPLQAADLVMLQQQGVSLPVIRAMQEPPMPQMPQAAPMVIAAPAPAPMIVEEYYYQDPWCRPWGHPHYYGPPRRPGVGVGIAVHN